MNDAITREEFDRHTIETGRYVVRGIVDDSPVTAPPPPPSIRDILDKMGANAYEVNFILGKILEGIASDNPRVSNDKSNPSNLICHLISISDDMTSAHEKAIAISSYLGMDLTNR